MEPNRKATAGDVAYQLMKNEARAMPARDLIDSVIGIMGLDIEDTLTKARVYTSINLDPRLVFLGSGVWGIRDWSVTVSELAKREAMPDLLPGEASYQPKAHEYSRSREDEDDEDISEEESLVVGEEDPDDPVGM